MEQLKCYYCGEKSQSYENTVHHTIKDHSSNVLKAKSRRIEGYSRWKVEKRREVRENWCQELEQKQVPKRGRNQVSGKVSVPCWHATSVANALWKPLVIRWRSSSVQGHEIGEKPDRLASHCNWSRVRMSFNIREKETSYCWKRSPYRPLKFLNDHFKRSTRYPCLSSILESRLALRIKHSYTEQAQTYLISWEIKTP